MIHRQVARENTLSSERKSNEPDQTGSKATRQSKERSKVGVVDSLPSFKKLVGLRGWQSQVGEQMKLYEGGYKAFKKCLVDSWPTGKVTHCAHMVMIDVKFPIHLMDTWWCVLRDINAFALSINMPSAFPKANVSTYLAMYYPKTSAALFEGKSKEYAFKIIMGEKADRSNRKTVYQEARAEFRKSDRYTTIKARSLSKKHDWNTVK